MLQGEHIAILATFIKLPFVIKIFVLPIFEWPFYTGFTVSSTWISLNQKSKRVWQGNTAITHNRPTHGTVRKRKRTITATWHSGDNKSKATSTLFPSGMIAEIERTNEPLHEISNNAVCATSKASDQPAHTRSLSRAFASRLNILWLLSYRPNIIWIF